MPQTYSAKKALRVSQRRRVINDRWRKKFRASVSAVKEAVSAGDKKKAEEALVIAQKNLDSAAKKNIIHPNAAARKKSRLSKAISTIS